MISELWDISWDQWLNRNAALNNTPMAADLSGAVSLNVAIQEECRLGSEGLPRLVRSVFPEDVNRFLRTSLKERKAWLVLIRATRESINDIRIQNEFTDPHSHLCKWVGM